MDRCRLHGMHVVCSLHSDQQMTLWRGRPHAWARRAPVHPTTVVCIRCANNTLTVYWSFGQHLLKDQVLKYLRIATETCGPLMGAQPLHHVRGHPSSLDPLIVYSVEKVNNPWCLAHTTRYPVGVVLSRWCTNFAAWRLSTVKIFTTQSRRVRLPQISIDCLFLFYL